MTRLTPVSIDAARAARALPRRRADSHKGDYGRLLVIGGSDAYPGALVLAAQAALRCGVGIVRAASVPRALGALAAHSPECTHMPLEAADGAIAASETDALLEACTKATAVLLGCGLTLSRQTTEVTRALVRDCRAPLVLDADGLNGLAALGAETLAARPGPTLLTPHMGEFGRLCGLPVGEVKRRPAELAAEYAARWGVTLALKDSATVVAGPDGVFSLCRPNSGLAKGGSGDVLAGTAASLLAQGAGVSDAAVCAVWLHAEAGFLACQAHGAHGMLPSDVAALLPQAILRLCPESRATP